MTRAEQFIKLQTWAVVGASTVEEKFGFKITKRLLSAGKQVYPVNPKPGVVCGIELYPNLDALPELPDIVDVVVPPAVARQVVEECGRLGIKRIWFQPGTRSPEAMARCAELGIEAVDDSCVLVELDKLGF
ncbi:MAG: CoA-binding protein [Firmicutes bacterium]|nr:CoA-binding protein [Bacillota bacterium]